MALFIFLAAFIALVALVIFAVASSFTVRVVIEKIFYAIWTPWKMGSRATAGRFKGTVRISRPIDREDENIIWKFNFNNGVVAMVSDEKTAREIMHRLDADETYTIYISSRVVSSHPANKKDWS